MPKLLNDGYLRPGTLRTTIYQADLSMDELLKLLQ